MKYRTKLVEIEAHFYDGNKEKAFKWAKNVSDGNGTNLFTDGLHKDSLFISTWEGTMFVSIGNYIICGLEGEFYACAPSTFHKKYELV